MGLGNYLRVALLGTACLAAVGSATSNQNSPAQPPPQYGAPPMAANNQAPPPQQMDPGRALGLWRSTFGAVKIEADNSHGGLQSGSVQGIWVYQRQGQEVIGYFSGNLRGNVMQFRWQEPNNPPLTGEGYLVFEQTGRQYSGRWWTDHRDRNGDWNGWREQQQPQQFGQQEYPQGQYGGAQYGYQPPPPPAYAPAPRQAPPQPYAPPPYQQPRQPQYPTYPAQPAPPPPSQNPYY
jgi:hypothetical protein